MSSPSHGLDEVPAVSSSPWLCTVRAWLASGELLAIFGQMHTASLFLVPQSVLDSSPHSCQLCLGHFCHDLKGNLSKLRLTKPCLNTAPDPVPSPALGSFHHFLTSPSRACLSWCVFLTSFHSALGSKMMIPKTLSLLSPPIQISLMPPQDPNPEYIPEGP